MRRLKTKFLGPSHLPYDTSGRHPDIYMIRVLILSEDQQHFAQNYFPIIRFTNLYHIHNHTEYVQKSLMRSF